MKTKRQRICEWFYRHKFVRIARLIYPAYTDHMLYQDLGRAFQEGFKRGVAEAETEKAIRDSFDHPESGLKFDSVDDFRKWLETLPED